MVRSVAFVPSAFSDVQEPTQYVLFCLFNGLYKNVFFSVLHRNTPASHSDLQTAISIVLEDPLYAIPTAEAQECLQAARSLV